MKLTKVESGTLQGAFVVEEILSGGSAQACGQILTGDVLQALTVAAEGEDRSGWTDVMSSFVGGAESGSLRQTLVDAAFISTLDDLVDAIQGNKALGPTAKLLLIFERDAARLPAPAEPLEPWISNSGGTVVKDFTDGLVSATRSTDIK
mmetsp:Transcript_17427/g.23525  ORF Transcript_17427/g.23525 Transcript_17427/m.23525 type:complete len:149 (-) Transcript_17427:144-590(-)